jgi:hypothetical protein
MTPRREPNLLRTQLRMGLIGVGLGLLLIVGAVVLGATTDLSSFGGVVIGVVLIALYGGQAIWAATKRRHADRP